MNEEKLGQLENLVERLSDRQALDLLLLVTGSRPACLIMDPQKELKDKLENFCEDTGLSFRLEKDSSGGLGKQGVFITDRKERLEKLEDSEGRFYGVSDRHVGEFLGFPKEDVDYFHRNISEAPVEPETREKKQEMISEGEISKKEAETARLVSYVPEPSEKGVKRAVGRGKAYLDNLERFDCENDTGIGSRVLENFYGKKFS